MNRTLKYTLTLVAIIGLFNFLTIVSFLYFGTLASDERWLRLLWMFVGSVVSAAITVAVVFLATPVLRDFLITLRRLLRFDNLSHPLLVRLSTEAPGTYHHSLMIANLAHRVAKATGADPLLARIGAYYHDVGKLKNPELYIENQEEGKAPPEPHDYTRAARSIIAHVQEGLKLAKEYKLPPEIVAFIAQHHGTSLVRYYYDKAKEAGRKIRQSDFRYDGPKPLSVEAAIVMLADAIEARVRALGELTPQRVRKVVEEAILERIRDQQLELVNLSDQMLKKLYVAFTDAMLVMHHRRLKYPADIKAEAHGT